MGIELKRRGYDKADKQDIWGFVIFAKMVN